MTQWGRSIRKIPTFWYGQLGKTSSGALVWMALGTIREEYPFKDAPSSMAALCVLWCPLCPLCPLWVPASQSIPSTPPIFARYFNVLFVFLLGMVWLAIHPYSNLSYCHPPYQYRNGADRRKIPPPHSIIPLYSPPYSTYIPYSTFDLTLSDSCHLLFTPPIY